MLNSEPVEPCRQGVEACGLRATWLRPAEARDADRRDMEALMLNLKKHAAAICAAWARAWAATRRRRTDREWYLASSVDQVDRERRERAWGRKNFRDGSLLGW